MYLPSFHLRELHLAKFTELGEVFAASALRAFAFAMVGIFIPIYLLRLGYSLTAVLGYSAAVNLGHALLVIPATWIASRFGIKHCMIGSVAMEVIYFLLLAFFGPADWWTFSLLIIVASIYRALYFTGLHLDLSKITKPGHRGTEIGGMRFFASLLRGLGPMVGGFLLAAFGFFEVFVAAAVVIVISAVPLMATKDIRASEKISLRKIFKRRRLRDFVGYTGYGIEEASSSTLWALFVFLNIVSAYEVIGSIASGAIAVSLLGNLVIGKMSNHGPRRLIKIGGVIDAVFNAMRVFVTTATQAFGVSAAGGISKKLLYIPMDMLSYERSKDGKAEDYIVFREISINGMRGLFYLLIIAVGSLKFGLALGAAGSLLMMFF